MFAIVLDMVMMSIDTSIHVCPKASIFKIHSTTNQSKLLELREQRGLCGAPLLWHFQRPDHWNFHVSDQIHGHVYPIQGGFRFACRSFLNPSCANNIPLFKSASLALSRSCDTSCVDPLFLQLVPALGVIVFAVWGLSPLLRHTRNAFANNDISWKNSQTHYIFTSYLQPLFLWFGTILVCRAFDPVISPSQPSQAAKGRLLHFVKSLSSLLAFTYCLSSLIQQMQKNLTGINEARNMGFTFAGKAVSTAIWIGSAALFMDLVGVSTQKLLTAGGLGTVLLTLAGREMFTNFLASIIIHSTRPFVLNEWIQMKIDGYDVSGFVEHVGWWSPTIIRGEDREAIHIPNHRFTVSVVRNLSKKTHYRIKTHFAISLLDASKISNIVADMRKVLAKNTQIEQQKLHRRVFLEYINPENQAFMIFVSCFVKTSRLDEYFCVKQTVILDFLRVINYHKARLATPVRTIQKMCSNDDMENTPFGATSTDQTVAEFNRLLYLTDTASKTNTNDKRRGRAHSKSQATYTEDLKNSASHRKCKNSSSKAASCPNKFGDVDRQKERPIIVSNSYAKPQLPGMDSNGLENEDCLVIETTLEKPPETVDENEKLASTPPVVTRNGGGLEDNMVLGVALDGPKRILPIEVTKLTIYKNDSPTATGTSTNNHVDPVNPKK